MHWFFDPTVAEDSITISTAELVHFRSLRILSGDQIMISSGKGFGFSARVLDPHTGQISIQQRFETEQAKKFHLIQAIAKGGRDEAALQSCTELGISTATAVQAERSVSRWDNKIDKNIERWRQIAVSAIKQSQQLSLPEIHYAASVSQVQAKGVSLVLDPRATTGIANVQSANEYSIAVGPEGGFSETEISTLVANGFLAVRLGDSVLRTSNAGVVALACLQLSSGQLGKDLG